MGIDKRGSGLGYWLRDLNPPRTFLRLDISLKDILVTNQPNHRLPPDIHSSIHWPNSQPRIMPNLCFRDPVAHKFQQLYWQSHSLTGHGRPARWAAFTEQYSWQGVLTIQNTSHESVPPQSHITCCLTALSRHSHKSTQNRTCAVAVSPSQTLNAAGGFRGGNLRPFTGIHCDFVFTTR